MLSQSPDSRGWPAYSAKFRRLSWQRACEKFLGCGNERKNANRLQSSFISQVSNYAENTFITTAAPRGAKATFSDLRLRILVFQNMHKLLRCAAAQTNNAIHSHDSSSSAHKSRRMLKLLKLLKHLLSCTQTQQSRAQLPQIMDDGTQISQCAADPYSQGRFKTGADRHQTLQTGVTYLHTFTKCILLTRRWTETTSREPYVPLSRTYINGWQLHLTPLASRDRKTIPTGENQSLLASWLSHSPIKNHIDISKAKQRRTNPPLSLASPVFNVTATHLNGRTQPLLTQFDGWSLPTKAPYRISDKLSLIQRNTKRGMQKTEDKISTVQSFTVSNIISHHKKRSRRFLVSMPQRGDSHITWIFRYP